MKNSLRKIGSMGLLLILLGPGQASLVWARGGSFGGGVGGGGRGGGGSFGGGHIGGQSGGGGFSGGHIGGQSGGGGFSGGHIAPGYTGGGHWGGGHPGTHWGAHSHGWHGWGYYPPVVGIGLGWGYGLGYYNGWGWGWGWGAPYYYPPYSSYGYPAPAAPPVYIQRQDMEPAAQQTNYWYYCRNPEGYYPYVKECAEGWIQVAPRPSDQPSGQ